jgi:hypothetical protein
MKLTNYNDFILESKIVDLILEANISFESDFKSILKNLSKNDRIASELLKLDSSDVDIDNNFVALSDKNDTVSFMSDKKASKYPTKYKVLDDGQVYTSWSEMEKQFGIVNSDPYSIRTGDLGIVKQTAPHPTPHPSNSSIVVSHFLRDDGVEAIIGLIGLSKIGKVGPRSDMKVGRLAKKFLDTVGVESTSKEIEEFVNKFKSEVDLSKDVFYNFKLVSGEYIRRSYDATNYAEKKGTLSNSCMRYDEAQKYLDIYVENPDKIKLLAYYDTNGKVKGRALVWKLDQPDITFMDRIYTNNDADVELFKKYATEKGWAYKQSQNSVRRTPLENYSGEPRPIMGTKLSNCDFDYYPYMDTLTFMTSDGYIHNDSNKISYYMMKDTDGEGYYCNECEGRHEWDCDSCDGSGSWDCDDCNGRGEFRCDDCDGTVECGRCDGSGKEQCNICDGDKELECPECDGSGESEGKPCSNCDSSGKVSCPECDGEGEKDCKKCESKGKVECGECSGDGENECSSCDGGGKQDCHECNGRGEFRCDECSNIRGRH